MSAVERYHAQLRRAYHVIVRAASATAAELAARRSGISPFAIGHKMV